MKPTPTTPAASVLPTHERAANAEAIRQALAVERGEATEADARAAVREAARILAPGAWDDGRRARFVKDAATFFDMRLEAAGVIVLRRDRPPEDGPAARDGRPSAGQGTGQNAGPDSVEAPAGFPPRLYGLLPPWLRTLAGFFDEGHARDVFLTAALPVLAGMMPGVRTRHADGLYSPDLYTIVLARAGAGKGAASWALRLAAAAEARLLDEYRAEREAYDALRAEQEAARRARSVAERSGKAKASAASGSGLAEALPGAGPERNAPASLPPEPVPRSLLLEADTSAASLKQSLAHNGGRGVLAAQEIDTLTQANGREWGGFSDVLRQAFHHETIGSGRKGDGRLRIPRPCLSVMLTGTPGQFAALVPGVENGLFSRLCPYLFDPPEGWKTQRPGERWQEREDAFTAASARLDASLFAVLDARARREADRDGDRDADRAGPVPLWIDLRPEHWDRIDETFAGELARRVELRSQRGEAVRSEVIQRAALVAVRLASALCVVRAWSGGEDLDRARSLTPSGDDVEAALLLSTTFLRHAFALAGSLPQERAMRIGPGPDHFLTALREHHGEGFTTGDALRLCAGLRISPRTAERYLFVLAGSGHVVRQRHGDYRFPSRDTEERAPVAGVPVMRAERNHGCGSFGEGPAAHAEPAVQDAPEVPHGHGASPNATIVADRSAHLPYAPSGRPPVLHAPAPASGAFAGVRSGSDVMAWGLPARVLSSEPGRAILTRLDGKPWPEGGRTSATATAADVEAGHVVFAERSATMVAFGAPPEGATPHAPPEGPVPPAHAIPGDGHAGSPGDLDTPF